MSLIQRLAVVSLVSIAGTAFAADPAPVATPSLDGMWSSGCTFDDDVGFPTQDVLEIKDKQLVQHSLSYPDRKTCDQPAYVTRLTYRLESKPGAKKGQRYLVTPEKIELAAITVNGMNGVNAKKECDRKDWKLRTWQDCSKTEPYKSLIATQKMTIDTRVDGAKLSYQQIDETAPEAADEDTFTKATALPYKF